MYTYVSCKTIEFLLLCMREKICMVSALHNCVNKSHVVISWRLLIHDSVTRAESLAMTEFGDEIYIHVVFIFQ